MELLESMQFELVLGQLDNTTSRDDVAACLKDFVYLEAAAKKLGLEMNRSKYEVVGHTNITRKLFVDHNVDLPETNSSTVIMLGSPLSANQHPDDFLDEKQP
jgi:hypothetical protein